MAYMQLPGRYGTSLYFSLPILLIITHVSFSLPPFFQSLKFNVGKFMYEYEVRNIKVRMTISISKTTLLLLQNKKPLLLSQFCCPDFPMERHFF